MQKRDSKNDVKGDWKVANQIGIALSINQNHLC